MQIVKVSVAYLRNSCVFGSGVVYDEREKKASSLDGPFVGVSLHSKTLEYVAFSALSRRAAGTTSSVLKALVKDGQKACKGGLPPLG